jgi:hypothetical protein
LAYSTVVTILCNTGHCWRRSSATALVDVGGTVEEVRSHGRWENIATAHEYVDNSDLRKRNISSKLASGTSE